MTARWMSGCWPCATRTGATSLQSATPSSLNESLPTGITHSLLHTPLTAHLTRLSPLSRLTPPTPDPQSDSSPTPQPSWTGQCAKEALPGLLCEQVVAASCTTLPVVPAQVVKSSDILFEAAEQCPRPFSLPATHPTSGSDLHALKHGLHR